MIKPKNQSDLVFFYINKDIYLTHIFCPQFQINGCGIYFSIYLLSVVLPRLLEVQSTVY